MLSSFYRGSLLVLILWLLHLAPLAAQHRLGLSFGLEKTDLLDQNTSVLPYQGSVPRAALQWQYRGLRWQSDAELSVGRGHLEALGQPGRTVRFVDENLQGRRDTFEVPVVTSWTPVSASFSLLRTLTALDRPLRVAAGGTLSEQLLYSDGFLRPGLMNVASLAPQLQMIYQPEHARAFISAGVSVPIGAVVTRIRYDGTVSEPGGTALGGFFNNTAYHGPHNYRQWNAFVELGFRFAARWQVVADYRFSRQYAASPRPLDLQRQSLTATLQWLY